MKYVIIGGIGILSGIMLLGFTLVAAAVYALELSSVGYFEHWGLYGSALIEIGIVPILISTSLFITGLTFLYRSADNEWKAKYFLVEETTNEPIVEKENQ
ncbi:hypothetical protein A1A1_14889 [Planococcus antarcticus DSM 14505]|uniref:Phosphatase n=1 Tax=Planococcus antarcticus DSM 14505 TaxID=1185653 RepID=A0A1C7DIF0_9BACL|nr:hypothetical protein [Planococcus antarcticus]ANU11061.1 hypothetical protein BBH88_12510 [Planococcus antarcticus DSM 14505]EIM05696.1 hypothetical protein A1A1_14889 [Planococcus antarcticus DSM 14505]